MTRQLAHPQCGFVNSDIEEMRTDAFDFGN